MKRLALSLATFIMCTSSYGQNLDAEILERENITPLESGGLDLQLTPAMPENIHIVSEHGADFDIESGTASYLRGVEIYTDNGMQIFANQARVDTVKKVVHLSGDVCIYQNAILHRGKKALYNYETEQLETNNLRTSLSPILLDSDSFRSETINGKRVYVGENAGLTTHDKKTPNFWLRANKIKVYPEEKVVFNNLKIYAGDRPIFWLPYLSQPLDAQLGYHFTPGARSNWGAFLLNSYGVMLGGDTNATTGEKENQWLLSEWLFDMRSKRGLGAGVDFSDTRLKSNSNLTGLKFYYANDRDPSISRSGISRSNISNDRYKIELKHRIEWESSPNSTNLFDINLTHLSDLHYLEDFVPSEYSTNSQPDNIIGVQRRAPKYQLGAFTRFQLNDFYQADSRLPEVYLDQVKRPVFGSSILHEGSSSLGFYREDLGNDDQRRLRAEATNPATTPARQGVIQRLLDRDDFVRLHTYHELSRPMSPINGLSITPRVGAGFSQYWDEGRSNKSHSSTHGYLGLDTALKFSKNYSQVKNDRWGLNELLHVVQPYANLSILSTDELDSDASKIDRLTPTERPRTFDVGRYTAIDDFRNWSIVRLGARNQLLTKRDGRSYSWLTMDTYVDAFLNDPEFNRDLSNLYNDLIWKPVPWGSLNLNTQFPINSEGFTELTTNIVFWPHEDLEIGIGHSYLSDHPTILDSNLIRTNAHYRISHKWGVGTSHQWQLDDNVLERQEYTFHRNFDSWTVGFGLFQRNNRLRREYGALFNISLNALPSLNLPFSIDAQ